MDVLLRGLRQEDHLSLFLFLIVVEGLIGLIKNVYQLKKFKGFSFDEGVHFEVVQFADDTVLISDGSWDNLWTMKALLRGFELTSRLCVNL